MRTEDGILFSPNYNYMDINWFDKHNVINAFKDRIEGFYIQPAECMNGKYQSFAKGILCMSLIEYLARIELGLVKDNKQEYSSKARFIDWVENHVKEFKKIVPLYERPDNKGKSDDKKYPCTAASRLYHDFRCGLVHEGRLKTFSQFTNYGKLLTIEDKAMIVNIDLLLEKVELIYEKYMDKVSNDDVTYERFLTALKQDHEEEKDFYEKYELPEMNYPITEQPIITN